MTEEARWLPLVAVADVPESGLAFTFPSGPFTEGGILIRTGTGVRAWLNRCRHLSVPLDHDAPGEFLTGDRRHLVCGKHGRSTTPRTGCAWRAHAAGLPFGRCG